MANLCCTCYKLVGDKEEVQDLYQKLHKLEAIHNAYFKEWWVCDKDNKPNPTIPTELVESDYGYLFLGSVIKYFGGDYEKIECSGEVQHIELLAENILLCHTLTKWSELSEIWDFVISHYKSIKYYFVAEEPSCKYFINSDTTGEYFDELYHIDHWGNETETVNSEELLFQDIAKRVGVYKIDSFGELDRLIESYNANNPDDIIIYNKFKHPDKS